MDSQESSKQDLFYLLSLVFILRFITVVLFPNMLWPDEIFQTLEQSHRLVFGYGYTPWEFRDGIRNWLFPGFLSLFVYIGSFLGPGSWGYSHLIYMLLCAVSLIPVYYVYKSALSSYGRFPACASAFLFGSYSYLIYMAPKAFNETVAAHLFFLILLVFEKMEEGQYKKIFITGLLTGLLIVLRIQYAITMGLVVLWFVWKKRIPLAPLILGSFSVLFIAGVLDFITWHYPFQSFWLYFYKNLILGISKNFGVEPWYFYLKSFYSLLSFNIYGFIILSVFAVMGLRQKPLLFVITLSVLIPHSFIPHKEFRFVYLASICFIAMSALGFAHLLAVFKDMRFRVIQTIFAVLCLAFLFSQESAQAYKNRGDVLKAFQSLSTDDEICGLATRSIPWAFSGGYYYLHKKVPIVSWDAKRRFSQGSFNRIISDKSKWDENNYRYYKEEACFQNMCIYKRDGYCF